MLRLGIVGLVMFGVGCDPVERDRQAAADRKRAATQEMVHEQRAQLESAARDAAVPHAAAFVDELARIARDPTSAKPTVTQKEDELDEAVYAIAGFDHAELHRVRGHPEAWSWLLQGTSASADDFGPPRSVHDLLSEGPASIGGYQVRGLIHRIDAGPLAGAILVYSPASPMTPKRSFQLATVAFHQQSPSMMMGALCEFGAVDGVPAHAESGFKDECFAAVARRARKPVGELFPKPWMIRAMPDKQCNLSHDDTVAGVRYKCRWDAKTRKTTITFR
jgi:hypothetical protein